MTNLSPELKGLLDNFTTEFFVNLNKARQSGGLEGGESDVELGRAILVITADQLAPLSPHNRIMLANLRNFI